MKILHLDTDDIDNPLTGGGARKNFEIYRRLSGKHDVTVLTATFPGSTKGVIRDGVRYVRLGKGNKRFGLSYHFSYLASLPFAIKQFPHDLLVEEFMAPCGGIGSFLWTRKPVVSSIQWLFARAWAKKYKIPFHLGEEFSLRIYKKFIVQSSVLKEKIAKVNKKAITEIIYPGIDSFLLDGPLLKGEYILFIGRIDIAQKGLDMLIRIFNKTRDRHNCKLVIAGSGEDIPVLKDLVSSLGIVSRVEFLGKVSDPQEKMRLFSKARFVCVPSRYETFGMVALEAFALGKPVLCFDIPALNELVNEERGCLVKAFDEEAYAEQLTLMANDDKLVESKARSCREFAVGFTWDKIALQHELFLQRCLE